MKHHQIKNFLISFCKHDLNLTNQLSKLKVTILNKTNTEINSFKFSVPIKNFILTYLSKAINIFQFL